MAKEDERVGGGGQGAVWGAVHWRVAKISVRKTKCIAVHTCTDQHYPTLPLILFLKGMYFVLTVQVPLTLPVVFCEPDSVFLRADTQE